MQFKSLLYSTFFLCLRLSQANGLKCYSCSGTENDPDTSCADDVESLGKSAILNCDKKFCTISRQDYLDPKGKLASITRSCMDIPQKDGVVDDATHRFYSRSCKTDLCNSGSGKAASSDVSSYLGDKSNIYVPGIGTSRGSATTVRISMFSFTVGVILIRMV